MAIPQFGRPEPGRSYPDRPAAFVVVEHGGRIALVHVALKRGGVRIDLPGGGLESGESPADAAARECGEEAGLLVAVEAEPFTRADHFFINDRDESHNTRGQFFAASLVREDASLKTEDDHTLVWSPPHEALVALDRDAHAWAVAAWLRRGRG